MADRARPDGVRGGPSLAVLLNRDLACVDLETTGGNPAYSRIIEIGVVTIDRDGGIEEWSTLVNPGVRIPGTIAGFTGIDDAMVADAPRFEDVAAELLRRLDGRLFIAHNARFDYGFIKAELRRLDIRWQARTLCTVKLSRRLHPEHPRHSLDALIGRYGLDCEARHRALGDARVLRDLLSAFADEGLPEPLRAAAEAVLADVLVPAQLPQDLPDELPEGPGVYRFYGEGDALLYVGKSKNLKTRVLAHFSAAGRDARERKLCDQVRRVEWQESVGELGALLAEARAVKAESPLYNKRLRKAAELWTIRLVADGEGLVPTFAALDALDGGDDDEFYGLFKKPRDAKQALIEIARAQGLCLRTLGLETTPGSCFAFQLGRCRGACVGREPRLLHDTRLKLALAGKRLKAWPYAGPVAVVERNWRGEEDLHVFGAWRYWGTVHDRAELPLLRDPGAPFDVDVYRLLARHLSTAPADHLIEVPPCPPA